jgi:multidrug efflux system membrane fusion protein
MKLPECIDRMQSTKWALATTTCLLAVLTLILAACSKKAEEAPAEVIRPVKIMNVAAETNVSGLNFPGTVRASQRVELAFQIVGGRLIELPIEGKEGQEVKQDELLARIDPKDFETNLRNVQGRLEEAVASLDLAKSEYARVKKIQDQDPGAVSGADIDRKREAVNAMEGRIRSLRAEVEAAKDQLNYTYLKAPFAGLIAQRFVDNFQDVKPKQPILALEDISQVELLVNVPENIIALTKSAKGEDIRAVVQFPTAPGKQFPLQLKEYATKSDPATQTYQVVLQMPQPEDINIFPGMTASVTLSLGSSAAPDKQMLIPAIAVVAKPDGTSYVWVVDPKEMMVHSQNVNVGAITGSKDIQILEGLKGGETIVVAGVLKLQEGMKVRLWDQQ